MHKVQHALINDFFKYCFNFLLLFILTDIKDKILIFKL